MPGVSLKGASEELTYQVATDGLGNKAFLGLVLHNHQPVGNFQSVFASAYENAYLPMLKALERHPSIHLSLHYSGPLLDWITVNRPEFLRRLETMAASGQIEIVGGAYYEPILPSIPESDRIGQIRMMSDFCADQFASRPSGLWLAERVWEPNLPVQLAQAGVEWTVVDDTHFRMVGLADDDLFGYYVTEDQGYPIKVFATSRFLRYSVPFKPVADIVAYLQRLTSANGHKIAVMGDDGEKFGVWPNTYEHCWGRDGWVDQLFLALEGNSSWLSTTTIGSYAKSFPPVGRIYLPCASYDEMMEWALPAAESSKFAHIKHQLEAEGQADTTGFMHGGYWRHFGVKYPEANWMHKRMLRVHHKLNRLLAETGSSDGRRQLWQAQCNCPYWHGVFGGLYLADIRASTYQNLVDAENRADSTLHAGRTWLDWENKDIDLDGHEELVIESSCQNVYVSPAQGGAIVEWDLRQPAFNVLATLARIPEAYHRQMADAREGAKDQGTTKTIHAAIHLKDPNGSLSLAYDRLPRWSLIDHLLCPEVDLRTFATGSYEEDPGFSLSPCEPHVESDIDGIRIELSHVAQLSDNARSIPFRVSKSIWLQTAKAGMQIEYVIRNEGSLSISGILGVEWNLNLLGGGHNPQAYINASGTHAGDRLLDSSGEFLEARTLSLGNHHLGIHLELLVQPSCTIWYFPVETVSNSEAGIEGLYQATCLLTRLPFVLSPGEESRLEIDWAQKT
jgi:hypothetical protein